MGTNGVLGFKIDNQLKCWYCHWDSQPQYLGTELVKFIEQLNKHNALSILLDKAKKIKWMSDHDNPSKNDIEKYRIFKKKYVKPDCWSNLLSNAQGVNGLVYLLQDKLNVFADSASFLENSMCCEWGYVLNFDNNTLDIYKGLQTEPDSKNPLGDKPFQFEEWVYYPCKIELRLKLNNPNVKIWQNFLCKYKNQ